MGKDSPSPPPPPDYAAAARAQGTENLAAARASAKLSNPTITSPLGTRTVTYGTGSFFDQAAYDAALADYQRRSQAQAQPLMPMPEGGGLQTIGGWQGIAKPGMQAGGEPLAMPNPGEYWRASGDPDSALVDISLSPEQQDLYSRQTALSQGLLGLGQGALDRTSGAFSRPFDYPSVRALADESYGAQTSRLDPQWREREAQERTRLANQGLVQGGEAYDAAMRNFAQARNDAYTQARLAAQATMPQTFQLATALRQQPLTELSAIRSGAPPQMPQFQPYSGVGVGAAPVFGAAQAQAGYNQGIYNQQLASENAMTAGLFGLGGSIAGALPWEKILGPISFSDRRLKFHVTRIGSHWLGVGIYEYDIFGRRETGVMADEVLAVKPQAVLRHPSGYLMVDYGML